MQERRSLFYTQEEIDTMKDVKKLERTNRDIIIDTLYLRITPDSNGDYIDLYPCDSNGTLLTSNFTIPNSNLTVQPQVARVRTDNISYKTIGGSMVDIYASKLWITTGSKYYYLNQAFPTVTYGKMYMPLKVSYLKYNSGTAVNSHLDVYYKEYEP